MPLASKIKKIAVASSCGRGFTLIELMVTITIVTVIMSIVLIENSKFNNSIILTNTAYEIALVARQAQVYGLSSRAAPSGTEYRAYGVSLSAVAGENTTVNLFTDLNIPKGNGFMDTGEEVTGGVSIGQGIKVVAVCFETSLGFRCNENANRSRANVMFQRPNPESDIRDGSGAQVPNASYVQINIDTDESTGERRCVLIFKSGQISVKSGDTNCPQS